MPRQPSKDRRVQKTERLLRNAMGALIHEKRYDAIVVREILQRANVGRSAFYAHVPNKDALLAIAIEQTLHDLLPHPVAASRTPFDPVVGFSCRLFEHVDRFRRSATAMKGRTSRAIVHHHLRRALLDRVLAAIKEHAPGSESGAGAPASLLADYVVSTFILVLNWWVDSRSTLSPQEVDEIFRSLVLPSLAALVAPAEAP